MKSEFDLNTIMYRLLKGAKIGNNGGIYKNETRPLNSDKEDIVINCIVVGIGKQPQQATSNVNIYVPDAEKTINGKTCMMEDTKRLEKLSKSVFDAIANERIEGIIINPTNMSILNEPSINQHFVNIRCNWNIQID